MSALEGKQKVHLVFSSTALYMCEECKKERFLFFSLKIYFLILPITTYTFTSLLT